MRARRCIDTTAAQVDRGGGLSMAKRKRRTIKKYGPHPTDVHVGNRVRLRRTMLGMSQTELSAAVGLAFQQISQNETGAIRIGAGRLYELSRI